MTIPTFRLDARVAVITGASKGLGRAMALTALAAVHMPSVTVMGVTMD